MEMGSKEATFTALATSFDFDDRVTDHLLKGPMQHLQDFCYYFTELKEIRTFVKVIL